MAVPQIYSQVTLLKVLYKMLMENTPGPAIMDKRLNIPLQGKKSLIPLGKGGMRATSPARPSDMLAFIHSTKSWETLYLLQVLKAPTSQSTEIGRGIN